MKGRHPIVQVASKLALPQCPMEGRYWPRLRATGASISVQIAAASPFPGPYGSQGNLRASGLRFSRWARWNSFASSVM